MLHMKAAVAPVATPAALLYALQLCGVVVFGGIIGKGDT
jgi:hypothetical protein